MARAINLGGDVSRLALAPHLESCACDGCTQERQQPIGTRMLDQYGNELQLGSNHYEYHGPATLPVMLTPGEIVTAATVLHKNNEQLAAAVAGNMPLAPPSTLSELVPGWQPHGRTTDQAQAQLMALGVDSHLTHLPRTQQDPQQARLLINANIPDGIVQEEWLLTLNEHEFVLAARIHSRTFVPPRSSQPDRGLAGIDMTSIGDHVRRRVRK